MAVSFMQKIRLALRGWSRRREEEQQKFLQKNASWGSAGQPVAPVQPKPQPKPESTNRTVVPSPDMDGLQAAYLDHSGQITYYLDLETGDVVESRDGTAMDPVRYKRVPSGGNDIDERRAFIATLEPTAVRAALMKSVASPAFRSVLASDRTIERAWYNFRTTRAIAAIEEWLKRSGLR